jgi:hypothetical protein
MKCVREANPTSQPLGRGQLAVFPPPRRLDPYDSDVGALPPVRLRPPLKNSQMTSGKLPLISEQDTSGTPLGSLKSAREWPRDDTSVERYLANHRHAQAWPPTRLCDRKNWLATALGRTHHRLLVRNRSSVSADTLWCIRTGNRAASLFSPQKTERHRNVRSHEAIVATIDLRLIPESRASQRAGIFRLE